MFGWEASEVETGLHIYDMATRAVGEFSPVTRGRGLWSAPAAASEDYGAAAAIRDSRRGRGITARNTRDRWRLDLKR